MTLAMLLRQGVHSAVAPVCFTVCQVLRAVQLEHQLRFRVGNVDLHPAIPGERDRQPFVHTKSITGLGQALQASEQECLARTACPLRTLRAGRNLARDLREEIGERQHLVIGHEASGVDAAS